MRLITGTGRFHCNVEKAKTAAFWVTVGLFIGWVVPTLVEFFRHLKYTP